MSAPFAWIAATFIAGISAASFTDIPFLFLVVSALTCLLFSLLSLNRARLNALFLLLLVFLTGCLSWKNSVEFPSSHIKNFVEKEPVEVIVNGVIANDPFEKEDGYGGFYCSFLFRLDKVRKGGVWQKVGGITLVTVSDATARYEYGDELIMKGGISSVPAPTNPGQFDYARYLARQKIYATFKVKDERNIFITGKNKLNPIIKFGFSIRQRLSRSIEQYLPREQAGLLSAMLLGQRQDLAGDLKDTFVQTGTVQVLATQYTKKHISHISYFITP